MRENGISFVVRCLRWVKGLFIRQLTQKQTNQSQKGVCLLRKYFMQSARNKLNFRPFTWIRCWNSSFETWPAALLAHLFSIFLLVCLFLLFHQKSIFANRGGARSIVYLLYEGGPSASGFTCTLPQVIATDWSSFSLRHSIHKLAQKLFIHY